MEGDTDEAGDGAGMGIPGGILLLLSLLGSPYCAAADMITANKQTASRVDLIKQAISML